MNQGPARKAADPIEARRLFAFNGGFFWQPGLRRILALSGYRLSLGRPGAGDLIAVWGKSPTSHRGEAMAAKTGAKLIRVEDAWLRSLFVGRHKRTAPMGLLIDHSGVHFDPSAPSDLETLLSTHPLDDTALLDRARGAIERLKETGLTKYSAYDPDIQPPAPGYVLVLDQSRGDASVLASGADQNRFLEMLYWAQENHPGARVLIKSHPEALAGGRVGYFGPEQETARVSLHTQPCSPWALLEGAIAVYTVSSQMGFEAIFAGHRPHVYGQPFYAGWGLTEDAFPVQRRQRRLTRAQLFAAAMLLYPKWYDPVLDRLCSYEDAAESLFEQTRAWRADRRGYVASGIRLWKRRALNKNFGRYKALRFKETPRSDRPWMIWASKASDAHQGALHVEDGFLRSKGLGAALTPAASLVVDDLGIYYDPARPSRLEELIKARASLRPDQEMRAQALIRAITQTGLSKYNIGGATLPPLPNGRRILVPGQVEDDASILKGAGHVSSNAALLKAVRAANPEGLLIYKPHPDVEAGLRPGQIEGGEADLVLRNTQPAQALAVCDEVWTMTSLIGFEALLRSVPVTTLGAPFYAGWGLTTDLGSIPERRGVQLSLHGLVHAVLIDYPRYFDPRTGRPCPVETLIERLNDPSVRWPGGGVLGKLQGLLAGYAYLWR